jgi:hypothetical protein
MTVGGGTLERWRSEKTATYLATAVAAAESNSGNAALFRSMADAAESRPAYSPRISGGRRTSRRRSARA